MRLAFPLAFLAVSCLILDNLRRSQGWCFALTYGGLGLIVLPGLFTLSALISRGSGLLLILGVLALVGFAMYTVPRLAPRPAAVGAAASPAAGCRRRGRTERRRGDALRGDVCAGTSGLLRLLRRRGADPVRLLSHLRQGRPDLGSPVLAAAPASACSAARLRTTVPGCGERLSLPSAGGVRT